MSQRQNNNSSIRVSEDSEDAGGQILGQATSAATSGKELPIRYIAFIAILTFVAKLAIGVDVPTSALFADDYNALNRAIYYAQGVLELDGTDYPFEKSSAGIVYYALIAPWVLFSHPLRLQFVFGVNAALGSLMLFFSALAIQRLTRDRSILIPLALGTLATPFVFNYYVMTENAVFAFLGILAFLVVDFRRTIESKVHFFALLLVVSLLPLTRAPGIAVLCGLIPLLWVYRGVLGIKRMLLIAVAFISAAFLPYVSYIRIFGSSRESGYATSLSSLLQKPETWIDAVQLSFCQLGYVFLSGAAWTLPLALLIAWQLRRIEGALKWKGFLTFCLCSAAGFLGLSLIHLIPKVARGGGNGWLTYGRYADPALLLIVIAGLACAFFPRGDASPSRWLYRIVAPIVFIVAMINYSDTNWAPVNQIGLGLYANTSDKPIFLVLLSLAVFGLFQIQTQNSGPRKVLLLSLILFNALTLWEGVSYTRDRAQRGEYALAASHWILANTPENAKIGYRWDIVGERAPGGIKRMWNIYRAMMFRTYPRSFVPIRDKSDLKKVDYLYTLRSKALSLEDELLWSNQDYGVYKIRDREDLSIEPSAQ